MDGKVFYKTNLQRVRIKRKMSQSELAARANIPLRTLQYYDQGKRKIDNAGLDVLCRLCRCLGCGVGELIENRELAVDINKYLLRKTV